MKRISLILLFLWMANSSSVMAAMDACSADGITKLKRDGWTVEEIRTLCANNSGAKRSAQQQTEFGQRCATKMGVCTLYVEPAPLGSPCYCNNPNTGRADYGQIIR